MTPTDKLAAAIREAPARASSTIWRCGSCGRVSSIDGARRSLLARRCGDCEGFFYDERDVVRRFGDDHGI